MPKGQLTLRALEPYCFDECVEAWTTRTHLVLDLRSEDEGGDWEEGAEDSLGAIAGVRAELASGDHRALYLAWLSAIGTWAFQDDNEEAYREAVEPRSRPGSTGSPHRSERSRTSCVSTLTCSRSPPKPARPPQSLGRGPDRRSRHR